MDRDELGRRLEEIHPASYAWAVACCRGDHQEAEEVLQTAYLKVLDGRARFGGRSALKTWFFAVVRRTAAERRRRRGVRAVLLMRWSEAPPAAVAPDPAAEAVGGERARRLRAALAALSERQRQVLELVFYHQQTVAAAAAILGISVGSARRHYARGKERLGARLAAERMVR